MAVNWGLYKTRVLHDGETRRERDENILKRDLYLNAEDNPACKNVEIDGEKCQAVIIKTKNNKVYEIHVLHTSNLFVGSLVYIFGLTYMVISTNKYDGFYVSGKMQECNYMLTWIDHDNGKIHRSPIIDSNATQYNSGEWQGDVLTSGDAKHRIWMPFDDRTSKMDNGHRLFMDKSTVNPRVYKITQRDTITHNDSQNDKKGIVEFMLIEDEYNKNTDSSYYKIADYHKYTKPSNPSGGISGNYVIHINKNCDTLVEGKTMEIISVLKQDDAELSDVGVWTVSYPLASIEPYFEVEAIGNVLKINAKDNIPYHILPIYVNATMRYEDKNISKTEQIKVVGIFG